jgi:hypothetical protein
MPTLARSGYFVGLPTGRGRAGFNINIDVQGDAAIDMHFTRISERSLNLRPAWIAIHADMIRIEKKQFKTQGGFRSGGWKPLADSTVERKERLGLGTEILVATRRLIDSLTNPGHSEHKFVPMKSWMLFGSKVPYVEEQQSGTRFMPARPPIDFNERDREGWLRIIRGWIMDGAPTKVHAPTLGTPGTGIGATLKGYWP